MSFNEKYDSFYRSEVQREFTDIEHGTWPKNRIEAILYFKPTGHRVLDIGCGDGNLLFQLRRQFDELWGLEFSAERLRQARAYLKDLNFNGLGGSAEKIPEIPSESIDCIVTADVIEHIPDVYAATSEMYRILKPGGILLINTPNIAFIKKRMLLTCGRFPSTSQPNEGLGNDILFDGGHLHYFTYRSLTGLLKKYGFVIARQIGFGKFGRIHNALPSLTSVGVQLYATKPNQY